MHSINVKGSGGGCFGPESQKEQKEECFFVLSEAPVRWTQTILLQKCHLRTSR